MKITKSPPPAPPPFRSVTITLETAEEVSVFRVILETVKNVTPVNSDLYADANALALAMDNALTTPTPGENLAHRQIADK
jgi:hypothetical protein